MDSHPSDKNSSNKAAPTRKPYEAPVLVRWGTLRDLTLAVGTGGVQDGGSTKGKKNTRV